ncbi:MAG: four helix bundle protein [Cyclobacteriaceae bacterium]
MRNDKENLIVDLSFQFALKVVEFSTQLENDKKFVIARQILKSGTSIGANIREAQNAESRADFIHKLKIAAKEADETEYWLLICESSKGYPFDKALLQEIKSITRVLSKIIGSTKRNGTVSSSNYQIEKSSN